MRQSTPLATFLLGEERSRKAEISPGGKMNSNPRRSVLPEHALSTVTVERAGELAMFAELVADPASSVRLVEVVGDPWIGKTHLLNEFVGIASGLEWTVAAGCAVRMLNPTPGGAVADALRSVADGACGHSGDDPSERPCGLAEAVAHPVTGLDELLATASARSTCRALDVLRSSGRLLLALDDAHWADDASVSALERLVADGGKRRLLVVVARRPRQTGSRLRGMLDRVAAAGRALRLAPTRLTDEQAGTLLPGDLGAGRRAGVLRRADGNPGLLRAFTAMSLPSDHPWTTAWDPLGGWITPCLGDFDALSRTSLRVLRSASALGGSFDPGTLAEAVRLPEPDVLVALDELVREDLVRWGPGCREYEFRDSFVRMMSSWPTGQEWRTAARHRLGAEDAVVHPRAAGTGSAVAGRPAVLADLEHRAHRDPAALASVSWWRAHGRRLAGRHREALEELRSALVQLPGAAADVRGRLWRAQLAVSLESGEMTIDQMAVTIEEVRAGWSPAMRPVSRVHRLALLATIDLRSGRTDEAEYRVHRAARWLGHLGDDLPAEQTDALAWLGVAASAVGRNQLAVRCYERGLRLAQQSVLAMVPWFAERHGRLEGDSGEPTRTLWYASLGRKVAAHAGSRSLLSAALLEKRIAHAAPGGRESGERTTGGRADPLGLGPVPDRELGQLSRREREIALLVSGGQTNQQIARKLGLSHKTVETYLGRVFKKLAVASRSEVAAAVGRAQIP